jgi:hypothetical protein
MFLNTACRMIFVAAALTAANAWADQAKDERVNLRFTPQEQTVFLTEMRTMLASVQGVVKGIADSDRGAIANFARISGNRMARATPASIRAKLPPSFSQIGEPTHMLFEELAVRAESDDMDMLARHATFRIR